MGLFTCKTIPNITTVLGSDYLDGFDITATTAKIKSRVYRITYTQLGSAVTPFYYPVNPEDVEVNYSIYTSDPAATNVQNTKITEDNILVYPNPTSGLFTIYITNNNRIENLEIFDVNGQSVFNKKSLLNTSSCLIDISFLPSGLYSVKLTTANKILNTKIIKY